MLKQKVLLLKNLVPLLKVNVSKAIIFLKFIFMVNPQTNLHLPERAREVRKLGIGLFVFVVCTLVVK